MTGKPVAGRLRDRVALITGVGAGQGRAAALRFSAEGAIVVGCGRTAATVGETVAMVEAQGGKMVGDAPVDLAKPDQAEAWVTAAAKRFGGIDIVYNNASAAHMGSFEDMTVDQWHYTMDNDLHLVFYVTRFAWPFLIARGGGVVINATSGAAYGGSKAALMSSHCAAKGAVLAFSRQLALEGASHGIRVVTLTPGVIETHNTVEMLKDVAQRNLMLSGVPMNRAGQSEEIAAVAAFLASDDASYMTGCDTIVDGGLLGRF